MTTTSDALFQAAGEAALAAFYRMERGGLTPAAYTATAEAVFAYQTGATRTPEAQQAATARLCELVVALNGDDPVDVAAFFA